MPRKRKADSSANPPPKRTRTTRNAPVTVPEQDISTLSRIQIEALPSAVLTSHLQTHHLVTSGNKHQKALRLYEKIHPQDELERDVDLGQQEESHANLESSLLAKVQDVLDKHTRAIEEKLSSWGSTRTTADVHQQDDNISEPSIDVPLTQSVTPVTQPQAGAASTVAKDLPPLPPKLAGRITKGEYIDFKELLPENMFASPDATAQASVLTLELARESGTTKPSFTIGNPKQRGKKSVDTFTAWMQAWNTYLAVVVHSFKDRTVPMLAYQRVITDAAAKFPIAQWYNYDKRFRLKLANDSSLSWANVQTGLWLECFTGFSPAEPSTGTNVPTWNTVKQPHNKQLSDRRPCTYCGSVFHFPHNCGKSPESFRAPKQVYPRAPRAAREQGGSRAYPAIQPSQQQKSGWCWQFNNTGECPLGSQCPHFHNCRTCGGSHPAKSCRRGAPT